MSLTEELLAYQTNKQYQPYPLEKYRMISC